MEVTWSVPSRPLQGRSFKIGVAACPYSGCEAPAQCRAVVHRFTMSVFVHSPQSQKYLLGTDLIANAPASE